MAEAAEASLEIFASHIDPVVALDTLLDVFQLDVLGDLQFSSKLPSSPARSSPAPDDSILMPVNSENHICSAFKTLAQFLKRFSQDHVSIDESVAERVFDITIKVLLIKIYMC